MFKWLTSRREKTKTAQKPPATPKPDKEALIAQAEKNARLAREAIGQDKLDQLAELLHHKQNISPAAQARKIIEKMDTEKISDHLRYLRNEQPTKH